MTVLKKSNHEPVVQNKAPIELRVLARLEVKKRKLLAELAEVESHYRQFSREIELKGIPIPWLTA
jgi:hypothetical protein